MTAYELREIKGVRIVNLQSYHRAVHEVRTTTNTYTTAWTLGWREAFKLNCRLFRRLHRWAAQEYLEEMIYGRAFQRDMKMNREWHERYRYGS